MNSPIATPRTSLGSSTVSATEVMSPVTVPHRVSSPSSAANPGTEPITGNSAIGAPTIAAIIAPRSTLPRRWPQSAANPPSTAPPSPVPRMSAPIQPAN